MTVRTIPTCERVCVCGGGGAALPMQWGYNLSPKPPTSLLHLVVWSTFRDGVQNNHSSVRSPKPTELSQNSEVQLIVLESCLKQSLDSQTSWVGVARQVEEGRLSPECPHLQLYDVEVVSFWEAAVVEGVTGATPAQVQSLIQPQAKVTTAEERKKCSSLF